MPTKGTMLPGFAKGVTGMGVGERRLIHIPWKLGYGKKGRAAIWGLEPQWCDDQMEDNFSGFRGICKHTVFKISLISLIWVRFVFAWLSTTDTKRCGSCVVREEAKDTSDERLRLRRILDLLWCRLERTLQSIWCWAERCWKSECLLLSVYMVSICFDWASWCKPLNVYSQIRDCTLFVALTSCCKDACLVSSRFQASGEHPYIRT